MHPQAIWTVTIKAVCASVLMGVAWTFTVRPAQADLAERRSLLATQFEAIERYSGTVGADSQARLTELTERVERFSQALGVHQSTPAVLQSVERLAGTLGVQIHRTDPRATQRRGKRGPGEEHARAELISDEFIIEFSGNFGQVVEFLNGLTVSTGVVSITDLRLAPSGPGVRGSATMTVFRTPPGMQELMASEGDDV